MTIKSKEQMRKSIEEKRFWLAIEELTLYLKENRKKLAYAIKNNKFNKDKDIEILGLSLENLHYKLKGIKQK